ncbi:MAG TPA: AAA family ATPase [Brumimicrobium sp.]|nr:AAA family ATPase [Brumimicrobium sp.]
MVIERKHNQFLLDWKNQKNRKPLILRGARQVGKTTLIKQFSENYTQFISLNLEKQQDAEYFNQYTDAKTLLNALLLERNMNSITTHETLLFIDEIQEVPKVIALLRYFYEEIPNLHVVAAGSLLEHSLSKVKSFPVGRVQYLYIFPLNFPEFLSANGMSSLLERLDIIPIDKAAHNVAKDWFHRYALYGGMPEIVKTSLEEENIPLLPKIYQGIWSSYVDDVPKYAKNDTSQKVIKHIMQTAPRYVDQRITFQGFGGSNYKSREVGESFRALDDAKVIQLIYPCTSVEYPIMEDFKKSPRMQFLDTGLLNHALGIHPQLLSITDLSTSYKGALLPHLITQEFISVQEYKFKKPNFWVRQKQGAQSEVDLVYSFQGLIIPIEVKSGKIGKLRSLHQFIEKAPHPYAVRMYGGEFSIEEHKTPKGKNFVLMNLPYYLGTYLDEYLEYLINNFEKES